jgi:glycosyltransferase involved in cell wall biosynthesis
LTFIDLPRHVDARLELAIDGSPGELDELLRNGWAVVHRADLAGDLGAYQQYIFGSRAEFTVARDQMVRPRTGWFSDRSASYLAAGRPVVTQDTGFAEVLPVGEGLFAFRCVAEAAAAIEEIERDITRHSAAARAIAEEYFAADKVIASLLDRAL